MKHKCHCGFREHLKLFRVKKLGFLGGIILVLHLLFHVAECLILPSLLVGLGGHLTEEPVAAASSESAVVEDSPSLALSQRYNFIDFDRCPFDITDFYQLQP